MCTVSSRIEPVPYHASPVRPTSPAEVWISPIFVAPPVARSRSSPSEAITGDGAPRPNARASRPRVFRTHVPVMPCCDGSPPVPIVDSTAVGSSGSDPAVASPAAIPGSSARCLLVDPGRDEMRLNHGVTPLGMSRMPTHFHTIITTRGVERPGIATPGIAAPSRTSGCGRTRPSDGSSVGAI